MAENGTLKSLTPKQRAALEQLLTAGDIKAAAQQAGVSRRTMYRWLNDDANFQQALRDAEAAALENLSRVLVSLARAAVGNLAHVLADPEAGHSHKLRASDIVLSNLLKMRELAVIEARLTALEARASESRN